MHNSMMEKRDYRGGQDRNPFQMGLSHGTIEEEEKYNNRGGELSRSRELDEYLSRQRDSSAEKV